MSSRSLSCTCFCGRFFVSRTQISSTYASEIWGQLTKNLLTKSGIERFRENITQIRRTKTTKLVYAIVRNDNEDDVVSLLNQNHYSVTRLSTTGGFLKKGNTTLMIGVEDEEVEEVISLIKQECGQHQKLTVNMPYISGTAMVNYATMPMTVEVGGATIFVINVDHYEKI